MIIISFTGHSKTLPLTLRELQFIISTAQKLFGNQVPRNLPLVLNCKIVREKEIMAINETWRHKKQFSPIIAFPDYYLRLKSEPIQEEAHLGDMFICPQVLRQKTRENFTVFNKQNFRQQFIRSFVHSLLHLYGFTHENNKQANLMARGEQQVLDIVIKKLIKK